MGILLWAARILAFLFLFSFAIKNSEPVGVHFFLNTVWHAPLVIVMLGFFVAGVAVAVLSLLATLFGLRRQVAALRRALSEAQTSVLGNRGPAAEPPGTLVAGCKNITEASP
jgi:uncharacterized integral membrane protein